MAISIRTKEGDFARKGSRSKRLRVFSNGVELFGAARSRTLAKVQKRQRTEATEERQRQRKIERRNTEAKRLSRTGPTPGAVAKPVKKPKRRKPGRPSLPPPAQRPNRAVAREVPRAFGRFVENLDNVGDREVRDVHAQVEVFYKLEDSPQRPGKRERVITRRNADGTTSKGVVRIQTMALGPMTGTAARNITSIEIIELWNATEAGVAERVISINALRSPEERSAVARRHLGPVKGRSARRRKKK